MDFCCFQSCRRLVFRILFAFDCVLLWVCFCGVFFMLVFVFTPGALRRVSMQAKQCTVLHNQGVAVFLVGAFIRCLWEPSGSPFATLW